MWVRILLPLPISRVTKLQSSALLVLVTTVILAAVLWAVDFAFQKLMTLIYTL